MKGKLRKFKNEWVVRFYENKKVKYLPVYLDHTGDEIYLVEHRNVEFEIIENTHPDFLFSMDWLADGPHARVIFSRSRESKKQIKIEKKEPFLFSVKLSQLWKTLFSKLTWDQTIYEIIHEKDASSPAKVLEILTEDYYSPVKK
jgi:hypothetical protein